MTPTPRTVVEAFLPTDGAAPLDLLYDTANAAGLDDQPVRLTIRRMTATGEIVQTGRGRRGAIALTDAGRARLGRDRLALRLALGQDHGQTRWDGRWHLLAVSVPESDRTVRDALRRELTEAGAAPVSTGLYLSPHDLGPLLGAAHAGHLVRAAASTLDVRGVTEPTAIAELLWPAAPIIAGYTVVERAVARARTATDSGVPAVLAHQLRLADALERAMRPDPLVPPELRADWPPSLIRRAWRETWAALAARLPEELLYRGWLA
ncbi:phenylacetic acid degradation operon negative regulatory protein [Actinoplanes octamycinicus]|uniref:Phenylacetic acid degradation operon negative regulatory protein n=1 Tax=Actinoplanes octamycinicus TaxID=135948 RepID=A0A7W7H4C3_9ACTN|nr:PaaX family transcriptional regulator [Actinoplanes octamycinicus]MBB4743678.1 phenylacetic acid degradation operon negative regulatory protein [Actinoplanes octamycinicus]GIE61104.1 putative repressor in the phenylacetic acid catabolism [Actinoplanes octamycinicus]